MEYTFENLKSIMVWGFGRKNMFIQFINFQVYN